MSFIDLDVDLPPWSLDREALTPATLADLDATARGAAWLLRPDEADMTIVRCVEAVPALTAEVRRLRARLEQSETPP